MADKELIGNSEQLDCSDCVNHGGDWDCDHVQCHKGADTISRAAAIDALAEWHDAAITNRLNNLPSAQKWIPWDSGRLPEESGQYIVTAYDGNISRVTFAKYQKRLKRWELTGARAYWRVLAWLPLPEPWKGRQDE